MTPYLFRFSAAPLEALADVASRIYFPGRGACSVQIPFGARYVEIAVQGRKDFFGGALADTTAGKRVVALTHTEGWWMDCAQLELLFARDPDLRVLFLSRLPATVAHMARGIALAKTGKSLQRIAAWLTTVSDVAEQVRLPLMHHQIAHCVKLRRPGVTIALQFLESHRLIANRRGIVEILDPMGLAGVANGSQS